MDIQWNTIKEEKGILIAADQKYEGFLLWFYKNLRKHSQLPIAFVDLGLSKKAKKWCQKTGYYFDLSPYIPLLSKNTPSLFHQHLFNYVIKNSFPLRPYWFAKLISLSKTCFHKTLFLDIDCEIKKPIDDIFTFLDTHVCSLTATTQKWRHALLRYSLIYEDEQTYSSAVVAYTHKCPIIHKAAEKALHNSHLFLGDQDILSRVIYEEKIPIKELPFEWNWRHRKETNPNIYIFHHQGVSKEKLLNDLF